MSNAVKTNCCASSGSIAQVWLMFILEYTLVNSNLCFRFAFHKVLLGICVLELVDQNNLASALEFVLWILLLALHSTGDIILKQILNINKVFLNNAVAVARVMKMQTHARMWCVQQAKLQYKTLIKTPTFLAIPLTFKSVEILNLKPTLQLNFHVIPEVGHVKIAVRMFSLSLLILKVQRICYNCPIIWEICDHEIMICMTSEVKVPITILECGHQSNTLWDVFLVFSELYL